MIISLSVKEIHDRAIWEEACEIFDIDPYPEDAPPDDFEFGFTEAEARRLRILPQRGKDTNMEDFRERKFQKLCELHRNLSGSVCLDGALESICLYLDEFDQWEKTNGPTN